MKTLAVARERLLLSDRDLSVLQAVISFHPTAELEVTRAASPVVYPSNDAICSRLNGMPCSTMRRHLNRLIKAGVLVRRDSPNGKRFARGSGTDRHVFGFDLSPLVLRNAEFGAIAAEVQDDLETAGAVRVSVMLMRRDLTALIEMCAHEGNKFPAHDEYVHFGWSITRSLRRKLDLAALLVLQAELAERLTAIKAHANIIEADELSTDEAQSEHHYHKSNKEYLDSDTSEASTSRHDLTKPHDTQITTSLRVSLRDILSTCSTIKAYAGSNIATWEDLLRAAEAVRPMMGIGLAVWIEAKRTMGAFDAASLLTAMLERFDDIKSPSAYMRHLAQKHRSGRFCVKGMLSAINRRIEAQQRCKCPVESSQL